MLSSRFLWQIWGLLGLALILSTSLVSLLVADQVRRDALNRVEQSLLDQSNALAETAGARIDLGGFLDSEETSRLFTGITSRLTIISESGLVLADNFRDAIDMDNHLDRPEIQLLINEDLEFGVASRFSETLQLSMYYLAFPVKGNQGNQGFLRLAVPLEFIDHQIRALRTRLILGATIVGLVVLLLGYFLALRITIPITEITSLSKNIARGNYQLRLPEVRNDELGVLVKAINELALNVEQTIDQVTVSRNRLAAVLAGLAEGVVAVDSEQQFLHINEAALLMLGISQDDTVGKRFDEVSVFNELKQLIRTCISEQTAVESTINDGAKTIECSCHWMDESGGAKVTGVIMVLEDVTMSARLEEVRSDFVANASHELKTPISAIRGLVETIIDDPEMPADVFDRFMDRIRVQAIRLDVIVQDLLQLSRFDSTTRAREFKTVSLDSVVRQVYQSKQMDASDVQVELRLEVQQEKLWVEGEVEALNQMITNLVDNALKYTDAGGVVTMRINRIGAMAQIEVLDDGIGISKDHSERIFERFYRVDRARSRSLGGTGLGLSIVKHIAQSHRGNVAVRSILGEGSTFTVQIPLANSAD